MASDAADPNDVRKFCVLCRSGEHDHGPNLVTARPVPLPCGPTPDPCCVVDDIRGKVAAIPTIPGTLLAHALAHGGPAQTAPPGCPQRPNQGEAMASIDTVRSTDLDRVTRERDSLARRCAERFAESETLRAEIAQLRDEAEAHEVVCAELRRSHNELAEDLDTALRELRTVAAEHAADGDPARTALRPADAEAHSPEETR